VNLLVTPMIIPSLPTMRNIRPDHGHAADW